MTVRPQKYRLAAVDSVQEHPANAKLGADDAILASIERLGFYGALLVQQSTGFILAGHARRRAAIRAGEAKLPMLFIDVDDDEALRILAGDNRLAELGAMDPERLLALLGQLGDLEGTGYSEADLLEMLGGSRSKFADPDHAGPVPEVPWARAGDVWLLGPHRLVCGSSTNGAVVDAVMAGGRASIVFTDPPYGVAYTAGGTRKAIANDDLGPVELERLLRSAFGHGAKVCWPGSCWYVCAPAGPSFLAFAKVLTDMRIWRQTITWVKDSLVLGRADYHGRHEAIVYGALECGDPVRPAPIGVPQELLDGDAYDEAAEALLYGWNPDAVHQRPPNRKQDTVWMIARPKSSELHPTMKPVGLVERALRNSSHVDGIVLDLFAGSGSTLVAAEQCGRVARLVELDPGYVDVICRRWQEGTGVIPVLEGGAAHDFTEDTDGSSRTEAAADASEAAPRRNEAVARQPRRAEGSGRARRGARVS